jgi:hypothetical protein
MKAGKSSATVTVFSSEAHIRGRLEGLASSVAMPRTSSTSFITGTGFMKWMPMNRSGRSVARQAGDRERGGVGGEDRFGLEHRTDQRVDLALDVLVFGRRLDDEVGGRRDR